MSASSKTRRLRLIFAIAALFVVGSGCAYFYFSRTRVPTAAITIVAGSDGNPRLLRVSVPNANAQDAVLQTMAKVGLKGELVIPPNTVTNPTQVSNVLRTLQAMSRAGVFRTNPTKPNPYE